MKIALFYFSGTGNTKYACEKFKCLLEQKNSIVILYDIETLNTELDGKISNIIDQVDLVGFAYPIYGANILKIMSNFINSNFDNKVYSKEAFIITTVGFINAYGPFIIKKRLKKYGFLLKWHYVYYTLNNTTIRKVNKNQLDEKHRKQKRSFNIFCNSIIIKKSFFNGIGPWIIGGYIVRNALRKAIANHYKMFFVENSLCINCNLCINSCPMKAINVIDGKYIFSEKCTTCLRCINKCPVNAIKEKNA
jgi:ferredoxin/flavodoxin